LATEKIFYSRYPKLGRAGALDKEVKPRMTALDRWLSEKRGDHTGVGREVGLDMIAQNIRNMAGDKIRSVVITGMADAKALGELNDQLKNKLDGIELKTAPDILHNPDALANLRNCDAVILAEQRDVSRYTDINSELNLISNAQARVLGAIII
jgi:hypothetical protein